MDANKSRTTRETLPDAPDRMGEALHTDPVPSPGRPDRTIVMVGLMGAGKTSVGRRLAQRLGLDFIDADHEIEAAAGCTIEEIFERFGETAFRDGERRIIQRLLERPAHVLATGGGAFIDSETRGRIKGAAVSVWLKADLEVLVRRVGRRSNRPLLKRGDPREVLTALMDQRYPIYAEADIRIDSADGPTDATVDRVVEALEKHMRERANGAAR